MLIAAEDQITDSSLTKAKTEIPGQMLLTHYMYMKATFIIDAPTSFHPSSLNFVPNKKVIDESTKIKTAESINETINQSELNKNEESKHITMENVVSTTGCKVVKRDCQNEEQQEESVARNEFEKDNSNQVFEKGGGFEDTSAPPLRNSTMKRNPTIAINILKIHKSASRKTKLKIVLN